MKMDVKAVSAALRRAEFENITEGRELCLFVGIVAQFGLA
jgi:hypothetical protein